MEVNGAKSEDFHDFKGFSSQDVTRKLTRKCQKTNQPFSTFSNENKSWCCWKLLRIFDLLIFIYSEFLIYWLHFTPKFINSEFLLPHCTHLRDSGTIISRGPKILRSLYVRQLLMLFQLDFSDLRYDAVFVTFYENLLTEVKWVSECSKNVV